ncbi:MAG TPA: thioredoxin [Clostridia bacterium]|jgi:thioredoxin 1|nr:thioredoxin [Clostridia bacterium]
MTKAEFNEFLKDQNVLVDFYANWCGPCKLLSPHLREAEGDLNEMGVKVLKVNVDDSDELCSEYRINYIPTVILFVNGALKGRFTGVKNKDELIAFVKEFITK